MLPSVGSSVTTGTLVPSLRSAGMRDSSVLPRPVLMSTDVGPPVVRVTLPLTNRKPPRSRSTGTVAESSLLLHARATGLLLLVTWWTPDRSSHEAVFEELFTETDRVFR